MCVFMHRAFGNIFNCIKIHLATVHSLRLQLLFNAKKSATVWVCSSTGVDRAITTMIIYAGRTRIRVQKWFTRTEANWSSHHVRWMVVYMSAADSFPAVEIY